MTARITIVFTALIAGSFAPRMRAEIISISEVGQVGVINPATACANTLALVAACNELWGAAGVASPSGNFTVNGAWLGADFAGWGGIETLTATVTDVNGGAGTITVGVVEDYTLNAFAASAPFEIGLGVLTGTCAGGVGAGSSITGQIFLNLVASNVTGGACAGGNVNGNIAGVIAATQNPTFFDAAATFTFTAASAAGSSLSIPLSEIDPAPEPSALALTGVGLFGLAAASRRLRRKRA